MKVWCESCKGKAIEEGMFLYNGNGLHTPLGCPVCKGKGYTEDLESERLADIGRATEKVFKKGGWIQIPLEHDIDTTDDLIEWAKDK